MLFVIGSVFQLYIFLAKVLHTAVFALWLSSVTGFSSVEDKPVAKIVAFLRRKQIPKDKFNLLLVFFLM